jgi:SAM-dependent methyltransferase
MYAYDDSYNGKICPDKVVTKMLQTLENPRKYGPNLEKGIITETNYPEGTGQDQWGVVYKATEDAIGTLRGYCADISAGTGRNTIKMLNNSEITSVLATDIDPRPLEILYPNTPDEYKSKLQIQGDVNLLNELPFKDNTFDGALVAGVLHFFEDIEEICKEIDRVTKERVVIELETDIKRTTLEGKPFSYIPGGSPDDLKIYSSEKAKELLPKFFEGYDIQMSTTSFKGVLREGSKDPSVPPYLLECNTIVFNMEK